MRTTKRQRQARFFDMMTRVGFNTTETETLLKAERTLQRWAEAECGTGTDTHTVSIERDETTGKPFRRVQFRIALASGPKTATQCETWRRQPCGALRQSPRCTLTCPSITKATREGARFMCCALVTCQPVSGRILTICAGLRCASINRRPNNDNTSNTHKGPLAHWAGERGGLHFLRVRPHAPRKWGHDTLSCLRHFARVG
jgi:hypothetical protein